MRRHATTIKLLQRFSNQLIDLRIQVDLPLEGHTVSEPVHLIFPQLNTLVVSPPFATFSESTFTWPFIARTPMLLTYAEESCPIRNIHKDTQTVTRLAFSKGTDLKLFPNVQDVIGHIETMTTLIEYLESESEALPHLKRVTFPHSPIFENRLFHFNRTHERNIAANIVEQPPIYLAPLHHWDINAV